MPKPIASAASPPASTASGYRSVPTFLRQTAKENLQAMNAIKTALDPQHILNNGKSYLTGGNKCRHFLTAPRVFTDSVIRRMTRISNQYGAVNLSQGFPRLSTCPSPSSTASQVAYEDYHQYSITWGAQDFREALAKKQSHFMGRDIDPNGEIVVTCGSTEAMMAAMMTVANPGDKVVIFSPFYENYSADTILSGCGAHLCAAHAAVVHV